MDNKNPLTLGNVIGMALVILIVALAVFGYWTAMKWVLAIALYLFMLWNITHGGLIPLLRVLGVGKHRKQKRVILEYVEEYGNVDD